jgi:hypothetical protein
MSLFERILIVLRTATGNNAGRRNVNLVKCVLACSVALVASACTGEAALDRKAEAALAEYHTTCLKRRLAIDTPEHADCVAALYQERQAQLVRLRDVAAPAPPPASAPEPDRY